MPRHICPVTSLERYYFTLKSTFFCHSKGRKYKEQTMENAHVVTNKKAKLTMTSEPNYTLER
jgi:hypothetical protein